jgi:hypothetical protein
MALDPAVTMSSGGGVYVRVTSVGISGGRRAVAATVSQWGFPSLPTPQDIGPA